MHQRKYMCLQQRRLHTYEKQIKSVKNACVSGETLEKKPLRVLETQEKDSEKEEKRANKFKKRLKKY